MNRSGAYDLMQREYVTAPVGQEDQFTITAIAARYNRGKSSVARMSRIQKWKEKRAAYRHTSGEITADLDLEAYAGRLHEIHGSFIEATEKTLAAYLVGIENGTVKPTAGDVAKMVLLVRDIVNKPEGGSGGDEGNSDDIRIPASVGLGWLRSLEDLARERLESGAGEGAAEPKLVGSSEDGRIQVR